MLLSEKIAVDVIEMRFIIYIKFKLNFINFLYLLLWIC